MRYHFIIVAVLILTACSKQEADTIIKGGTIYTVESDTPTVEAVAVAGDTILYAGTLAGAEKLIGAKTIVIDLKGATMTPGIIEGHGHLMGLGYSEMQLDLSHVKSYDEMVAMVKAEVARVAPGQWIRGAGWHQDKWEKKPERMVKGFPTHELLSEVSPDNPVFLTHASGHAGFANAKAMEIAGVRQLDIERLTPQQRGSGEIIKDELGNPTGLFNERAQTLITDHIAKPSPEMNAKALSLAQAACLRNGVTSFHDAGVTRETLALLKKTKAEGTLVVRLYEMLTGYDRPLLEEWYARGPEIDKAHQLTIRSIKLNCDGALGSRGAWLLEPYSDRAGHMGNETLPMEAVLTTSRNALQHNFQVCSHAIGDRTNREVLDRYEKAFTEFPAQSKNARFRIEHAQHLDPSDLPRFAALGVIASMQAIHLSSDRPWAIERLGDRRIREGAYMWQSLMKSGALVMNGTDVPVEPIDPVANFYAAVTRETLRGTPEGGYEASEKMTRAQALAACTINCAFGSFEEKIKGTIAKGKLADFTIFSQDIMTIPEDQILKTTVEKTIVGGKVVFEKERQQ